MSPDAARANSSDPPREPEASAELTFERYRDGLIVHGYVLNAFLSSMIVQMTVELGGISSGYFVGLMLVIFAVNVLLPWRPLHSALNGPLTIALADPDGAVAA